MNIPYKILIPKLKEKGWFSFSLEAARHPKKPSAKYLLKMKKESENVERNEKYYIEKYGNKNTSS